MGCAGCSASFAASSLDFSQQHNPELALADINQVVTRVLLLTDHLFVPHRVRLETDLSSDMPELMIDRHMMEQVLMNLVLNAIQAMRSGGGVDHQHDRGSSLFGSGAGFGLRDFFFRPVADLRPFFTTKNEGEGTGPDSVSLGIVERHGDGSWLRVKSGRGPRLPCPFRYPPNGMPLGGFRERAQGADCR